MRNSKQLFKSKLSYERVKGMCDEERIDIGFMCGDDSCSGE